MRTPWAAQYLGISEYYLRNLRQADMGPKYVIKDSPRKGTCYYGKKDLDLWKTTHKWKVKK